MSFFAFMPAVAKSPEVKTKPSLPVFKAKWWYSEDCLDARPVIWSLLNRPAEWRHVALSWFHEPSGHEFHDSTWPCSHTLLSNSAGCSCSNAGPWQLFQKGRLRRVMRSLEAQQRRQIPAQFASHFIR